MNKHITDYKGKWVLITGAGKRVGADIARYMAARDLNILLHYHTSRDAAEKLKKELEEANGVQVKLVTGDLSKEEDVTKLFEENSPDVVINSAGTFKPDDFDINIESNTKAGFLVATKAAERMVTDKKKGVVFLFGDAGMERVAYPINLLGYTMSKAYIRYAVEALAAAYGKTGVRFIGILPGHILPPPTASAETIAAGRAGINMPDDELDDGGWIGGWKVGEAVYGLTTATAITGETVRVHGGYVSVAPSEH